MAKQFNVKILGLAEFQKAIERNPKVIKQKVGSFLTRAIAIYNRLILRQPWAVGSSGGGAPVATGNLRDTHQKQIRPFEARIYPTAPYAKYVHGRGRGEINRRNGLRSRPWLNYAFSTGDVAVRKLQSEMLKGIVKDLAK